MSDLTDAFDTFLGLPGLRGFWPLNSFDESGNAYDLSQHDQTLTYNGNPTYDITEQGTGYISLDGTGDFLSRADSAHYDILGTESYVATAKRGMTLGAWVYKTSSFTGGTYLSKMTDSGTERSYQLRDATPRFEVFPSGTHASVISVLSSVALTQNAWHFVVGRYDPSTELAIFVDGVKTVNTTSIPAALWNSGSPFWVGSGPSGYGGAFPGRMAFAFISAEYLDDAIIADLYNASQALFGGVVSEAETVTLTETVSRNLVSRPKPTETVTLTETVSRLLVSQPKPADTVTLTEAQTVRMTRQTSQAETVTLSETVSRNLVGLVGAGETVTLSEAQAVTMARGLSASETVTLTESVTVSMVRSVSTAETVTLTEAQSVIVADRISPSETITLSETGTAVILVSLAATLESVTLTEGVSVVLAASVSAAETVTLSETILISAAGSTNLLVNVSEIIFLSEAPTVSMYETRSIIVYDTLAFTETVGAPLLSITDTVTLSDSIISNTIIDTLTLADEVTIGNVTLIVEDTLTFTEVLELDGPAVTPPATAATSELDYNPVLRLLYGNDRRNPIRTLDLAQLAPGEIRLLAGGFAPGSGERNELWTDQSIRHDGQKKKAESLGNSQLAVTYVLKTGTTGAGRGSEAALSYFQRKINRFFLEAKQHQLDSEGHTAWLEYRWSDGLPDLATPTFGQLGNYYEVLSATAPKWPVSLHNDINDLGQGLISGVVCEITGSPAPKGLKQRAGLAGGAVTNHAKGVLIASGSSSKLHWPTYTGSGLTGQFVITGWITLNATWGSGNKYVLDYYQSASNRISIVYDATAARWTITKIVSGTTFTTNSASDVVANGDDIHLQLVQDSTTLYLYVNGVLASSITATATMTDGGTIALGCPATGTIDGIDVVLDGWRIMPAAITSTYALALYEAELPIKQDGGQIGPPPYWLTRDGDGQVDNVNDTSRDNYGIIGGIGGDLEAELEIQMNHSVTGRFVTWLGLKANDELVTASDYYYFESIGGASTADVGSSNGTYSSGTGTSFTLVSGTRAIDPELLFNRYRVLARLYATTTVTAQFLYGLSGLASNHVFGSKAISYAGASVLELVDLGDLFLRHDSEGFGLANQEVDYKISMTAAGSFTGQFDFAQLLPWPYARVEAAIDSRPIVVEEGMAYPINAVGSYGPTGYAQYRGAVIRAVPHAYNYLFVMITNTDDTFDITHTSDVVVQVTPRYLLPGGMVA